ncbi:DoxX family protein [Epilithonimonas caeni]|uniref:DoxX family protein n=1 Tax=Epilithonimonas caeni TaxID=365343 RepID=UPI0004834426|nr:DoxX family protein [Epilithonimonas caeni]
MILKIINSILILVALFMGVKQGFAMFSGKAEMMEMFSKWGFSRTGLAVNGAVTMIAAIMLIFPKTFVWGNFIMAAGILLIICFHLIDKDLKGVMIELPFLLLNLIIIYLQHPFKDGFLS